MKKSIYKYAKQSVFINRIRIQKQNGNSQIYRYQWDQIIVRNSEIISVFQQNFITSQQTKQKQRLQFSIILQRQLKKNIHHHKLQNSLLKFYNMSKRMMSQYPLNNDTRQCTDCLCIIIYVLLSLSIFSLTCYSLSTYSIYSLITPTDSNGQICGIDLDKHPYLYFVSPHVDSIGRRVCVAECPQSEYAVLDCVTNSKVSTCDFTYSQDHQKNVEIYPTQLFIDRVCLPEPSIMRQQIFQSLLKVDLQDEKIVQIGSHWRLILISIPVSIISTLLLIIIMRYTACVSVYVLLILMVGLLFLFALYIYAESLQASQLTEYFGQSLSQQSLETIMAVTFVVSGVVIFVLFCCNRKKISLAIKLLKASAKFVNNHLYLIAISFIQCFCGLTMFIWWIVQLWGLVKALQIYIKNNQIEISPQTNNFFQTLIVVVHFFFFLWTYHLITQSGAFIVSGAVTNWYFANQTSNICCPSYDRYAGYHIGSVCAASFYLAVFGPIRMILEWMRSYSQAEQRKNIFDHIQQCSDWICCPAISRILTICNKGDYAYINIAGKNYCESSSKVMSLRLAHPVISGIMAFLEIIFNIILRLEVVVITAFWGYWVLHNVEPYKFEQYEPSLTIVCIVLSAYFVSKAFLTVYLQATDAIIICILVDKDENKDFVNCPEQFRQDLQQIIDEKGFVEEIIQ